MAIYRGAGGSTDTTDQATVTEVSQKAAEAATSATNAASSASEAATSASTASSSKTAAATSATNAAGSASTASQKASEATAASTTAVAAQTAVELMEASVESAESNAILYGNMANTAAGDATTAKNQAEAAATSANTTYQSILAIDVTAQASADAADASATEAESASAQASGFATAANNSADAAASSANSAAGSAQTASAAEANTLALFDQFGDQYLGSKATDPTLDNDGDALTEGDVYWNSTDNLLKFYNGSAWVAPEDVASTAASNALASETAAATSESNAAASASASAVSATASANSATAAATSATLASTATASATAAATSATEAQSHANDAYTYSQSAASAVAYQDLTAIAQSKADTAVDVFVYDTRKDSDGGAWRKRTQHTSWYNETLNTSTRGARKEFPAVAVIVAEASQVTIYDGDDPTLPMWKVLGGTGTTLTSVTALNGIIIVGHTIGVYTADFIFDRVKQTRATSSRWRGINLADNPSSPLTGAVYDINDGNYIVNQVVNDVAMTVLPNAPIDSATGLPVPTIAVATDGGVSVITDSGSVVDYTETASARIYNDVLFDSNYVYGRNENSQQYFGWVLGSSDRTTPDVKVYRTAFIDGSYVGTAFLGTANSDVNPIVVKKYGEHVIGTREGISPISNISDPANGMVSYITSSYNTGWMNGDIKGAFLSDTTVETVGVDESTELVTNGTFDSDTTGWTALYGSISSVAGKLQIVCDGTGFANAYQTVDVEVGKTYALTGEGRVGVDNFTTNQDIDGKVVTFVPTSSPVTIRCYTNSNTEGFTRNDYDNISVKQTGNLVVNGTFDTDTTGWTLGTATQATVISGEVKVTAGSIFGIYQELSGLTVGKTYTVSATGRVDTTGDVRLRIYGDTFNVSPMYESNIVTSTSNQAMSLTFVATSTSPVVYLRCSSQGIVGYFDNISVRLAEDDRSVNNNGLEVHGEITKSPVATGSDLVAYSGFSSDDYLMQPYNSDLDFGTGDFCVMGWVRNVDTSLNIIASRYEPNASPSGFSWSLRKASDNSITFNKTGGTEVLSASAPINVWINIAITRVSGTAFLYINGVLSDSASMADDVTNSVAVLTLGNFPPEVISYPFGGSLALWRISATAPTAEQIAKIYEDEKVLFQEGAQATLYGSSDAVTALAYDEDTELLHVGTSAGRSVFSGLRRVDNTTDAVGACISASNGMVAED